MQQRTLALPRRITKGMTMPTYSQSGDSSSRRSSNSKRRSRRPSSGSRSQRSGSLSRGRSSSSRGRRGNSRNNLRSSHNYRTLNGNDTGYSLKQRQVSFGGRSSQATFIALGVAVVVLVLLVFGISSCVRGCSSRNNQGSADAAVNTQDSRVAAGAAPDVTSKLTPALDTADALRRIADNADKYSDSRLIDLAVTVPEAANFVANYPSADHTAADFNDSLTSGTFPVLYDWDSRWGYTDYADGAFGVTGSGPTVLAMAFMGLTGEGTQTPYTVGQMVTSSNFATGEAGMSKDFCTNTNLSKIGLSANSYSATVDDLQTALSGGTPAAILVRANTLTTYAHWILVTGYAQDGSVVVNDPTSTSVSSHTWAPGTIVSNADAIFALSASTTRTSDDDDSSSSSSNNGGGGNSNSSHSSSSQDDESQDTDSDSDSDSESSEDYGY
jgi:hypothetical protein